ncbi:hypothetical protein G6F22_002941 [Rhizopus arrhizus]|nr:hypothetical protein G6F22_002941 [Rhizopus arrhizus]KAG0832283.1 hypothetical protein G6F19_006312 [Rhizopus arrhizus]KAG1114289.1 hypothetical protein G6F40_005278 [Rhizopus arrhizus]
MSNNSITSDSTSSTNTAHQKSPVSIYLDDGPLFRATIKEYEDRTAFLKSNLKNIISTATASFRARQNMLESEQEFIAAVRKASFTKPLFDYYLNNILDKLFEQQQRLHLCMQTLVIDPLKKLYELDVKVTDTKKKQFEDASKDYYVYLSKYLRNKNATINFNSEKKKLSTQLEFNMRKQQFDLARFDYYTFLTDLHGGKKEQEILYHLLHHHEKQYAFYHEACKTLEQHKNGLEDVASYIAEASREQKVMNQERDEKRKELESNYAITVLHETHTPELTGKKASLDMVSDESFPTNQHLTHIPLSVENRDKFNGIRDLQQMDQASLSNVGHKKEGFLYTSSKPNKRRSSHSFSGDHWHKYWCVLSKGQLQEYTNWKHQLQTHNQPILLKLATVKEAREAGRRFCFEVITPNVRRVYQATSSEELSSWMATINNAICGSLNGTGSCAAFFEDVSAPLPDWSPEKTISKALDGIAKLKPKKSRRRKERLSQSYDKLQNIKSSSCNGSWLLKQLCQQDPSNSSCADCSAQNPDWCSLNFGILLCIGTHISKVRSLTLDSESLTAELVQLLKLIGNARFNALWEYNLVGQDRVMKPSSTNAREVKARYVREKYLNKHFLRLTNEAPSDLLFEGILENDVPKILYSIGTGANLHQPFPLDNMEKITLVLPKEFALAQSKTDCVILRYPLVLALIKDQYSSYKNDGMCNNCLPNIAIEGTGSEDRSTESSDSQSSEYGRLFPLAELLLQNGCDIQAIVVDQNTGQCLVDLISCSHVVSDEAIEYLNVKSELRGHVPIKKMSISKPREI